MQIKKKRGRPKGSKNKEKLVIPLEEILYTYRAKECGCSMQSSIKNAVMSCKHFNQMIRAPVIKK